MKNFINFYTSKMNYINSYKSKQIYYSIRCAKIPGVLTFSTSLKL